MRHPDHLSRIPMTAKPIFVLLFTLFTLALWHNPCFSQQQDIKPEHILGAAGTPANPKVPITWNRYYSYDALVEWSKKIAAAYPQLAQYRTVGKTFQGRTMPLLVIGNLKGQPDTERPGFYMDGNIHSNEIQCSEMCLYTAWYLTEQYGKVDYITQLLDEKVFYIIPTTNPDGREDFFKNSNSPHSPRSTVMPVDDDQDGLVDEDGNEDINGDGSVSTMIRKSKSGRFILDPRDKNKLIEVEPGQMGEYERLGPEGIDNDGDGSVNEDGTGYWDPNRDWAWGWKPGNIQGGAAPTPFYHPETRAIADFVIAHPNISAAITYHNSGGMILRGYSNDEDKSSYGYPDESVYKALGKVGERMMPGYKLMITKEELYTVYGGQSDWFHGARGIFCYTGELYTGYQMYHEKQEGWYANNDKFDEFNKQLLFNDGRTEWKTFQHPQYGEVLIGGTKKTTYRINPGFLLESDLHRNMAFALYCAYHTPQLSIAETTVEALPNGQYLLTATIVNQRIIPTRSQHDISKNISIPDQCELTGGLVLAGMTVQDEIFHRVKEANPKQPRKIILDKIPGTGDRKVRWLVQGTGRYTIEVRSQRGGILRKVVEI
jgi:hypothetical protein